MANLCLAVLGFLIFKTAFSANKISLKCTPEFCDEYIQRFPCPPLDPACSDRNKSIVIASTTTCNCCEHCFIFQDLDEDCVIGRPGQPLPNVMCKPGTTCRGGKCVMMNGSDPDFHSGYHCRNGLCYCSVVVNTKIKTIFGTFKETNDITKEKQCGCSISAFYANQSINQYLSVPNTFLPIPRCLPNGQYDPLQCIDGMCGCVNKTTGTWDSKIRKVPISTLGPNNPKCFDRERHKIGQYYTNCEKERNNLMSDISLEDLGELNILLSHRVQCTPDGEYAQPAARS